MCRRAWVAQPSHQAGNLADAYRPWACLPPTKGQHGCADMYKFMYSCRSDNVVPLTGVLPLSSACWSFQDGCAANAGRCFTQRGALGYMVPIGHHKTLGGTGPAHQCWYAARAFVGDRAG